MRYLKNTRFTGKLKASILIIFFLAFVAGNVSAQNLVNRLFSKTDTASVPKEIEDPECVGINKEAHHATLMPYGSLKEALAANRHASSYARTLNGSWKFSWVDWPQKRPVNFYKTDYDVSGWKDIKVPSNWQVEGYGTPYYSNYNYIFQKDFPRVMSTPPVNFTAYQERNPVGSYRRNFELPANWKDRRVFVTFDGVDAGFFLWVNGKKVGYSVNSRNAAEFDITKYVNPGNNMIAVEVYRFTTGSYLEDQDMFRLSGIFRNVTLWSSPTQHIRDYFIKTTFDAQYHNAVLQVSTKVKNYGTIATTPRKLNIKLYNGSQPVAGAMAEQQVPVLKPGEEVTISANIPVTSPEKWTAETPKLYTTVLSLYDGLAAVEHVSAKTGFRQIEIKGRVFMLNGVPVKLKGVNRHENWPDDGHAVTEQQMIRDIELIKQANCNHVRTCHYSDDPRWYELCDEYGIYLVAEANLESHGAWDEFNEDPRIKAAIIDRNVANIENFKNHPSVLIWSLGNECGSGGSNFRAALNTIKAIDPTRPSHYEGFGIGQDNPADIDSRMYTSIEEVEKNAKSNTLTKPFYLCEYAHAMFNSMGSVDLYNDLFDEYPTLLGGAIWEWQDQGIYNNRDPLHPITAYGGGFGEYPNDKYFIHKGVVFSNRSLKPHYPELKHAYQWVTIKAVDARKGIFLLKSRYQFTNLTHFAGKWALIENGDQIAAGVFNTGNVAPGLEKEIRIPYSFIAKPGSEYFIRLSLVLSTEEKWAPKGYEVASQQLEVPNLITAPTVKPVKGALSILTEGQQITINGADFTTTFDKLQGTFTTIAKNGHNLLTKDGGPRLHLWRAPHQIDDMWAYRDWERKGITELKWKVDAVDYKKLTNGSVQIIANLSGYGRQNFKVDHKAIYTVNANGQVLSQNEVSASDSTVALARMGVRLMLNNELNQFDYYGRGPFENYADRKRGSDIGHYTSTVANQLTPYEKPMECGNHEDVRWANLKAAGGLKFNVKADGSFMQVSALPYTDEEMAPVEYKIDLPKSEHTVLTISHKTLGVGSNGCGPKPLQQYRVYGKKTSFNYQINL
ncbi:glycoside hydrolase family 2 TIM barrel-domain containing protein [Mucilaginibacter lutimaris]|uniref:beta-galactosidase n=1 Tax=Mucilaginibacter lutimaris TaxID=931629 RepID=A0ABW2ZKW6_9SPHI